VRVLNRNHAMSGNALRLMRSLAGVAGIVAFGVLLSGCAVFGNRPEPGSTGHLSLKDQLTPTAAAYAAPTVTKVSKVVPTRPISPPHADARAEAPGSAIGCASTDGCLGAPQGSSRRPKPKMGWAVAITR